MQLSRRQLLAQSLLAGIALSVRSVACGLPPAVLLNPRRALAQGSPLAMSATSARAPQYLILSTSALGDAINCNVPGTYVPPDMVHSTDASMAPTAVTLGGKSYVTAAPWASLGTVLDRTCFFHHGTNTVNHPDAQKVQRLGDAVDDNEMLISAVSKALSSTLGSVQAAPVALGPESVVFAGRQQPSLTPLGVSAFLGNPALISTLMSKNIIAQRDRDIDALNTLAKQQSTTVHAAFLDRYALSQQQAREASQNAASSIASLNTITSNDAAGQLIAALALVRMRLTPCVTVHVPFGGDNHADAGLVGEAAAHVSSLALLKKTLFGNLASGENITFASLNVFGRDNGTLSAGVPGGRDHNAFHHALVMTGPNVKSSVIGGIAVETVTTNKTRARAQPIDSATGLPASNGDISLTGGLASAGATLAAALGTDAAVVAEAVPSGIVVNSALI